MPDDISDGINTTGRVTVGNSLTGEIETTSDSDAYAVELVAGQTYRIDLEGAATGKGTLADPFLRWLRDSSGQGLHGTRDYDGGEGLNPRQVFTPQLSGTYYITASGQGDSVGTYTLTVTDTSAPVFGASAYGFELAENTDGGATRVSLGTVSATDPEGASVVYSIVGGNESGSFEIDAASGELFYVGAGEDYEAGAGRFDLTIRASDGDLSTDASVSVVITDVPEQMIVAPPDPENLQSVSEPDGEDLPTNTSTLGRVAVGGVATGNIGRSGDRDGFAVELVAGRTYSIDLRGSETDDGTLSDPYLHGIKGPDGRRIAGLSDDDGGEGYNSRLNFTPTESGTHYIIAGAYYTRQGTYELEVRDVSPQTAQQETVNEAPAFASGSYAFDLAENAGGDTIPLSLGLVQATDPENSPITYSIESGDPGGLFAIDPGTGALSYRGAGEDYESGTTSYEFTVRASDGGLHGDVTVTVNVTDVAEAPAFAETSYAFDLAENAGGDTVPLSLGAVAATDPENSPITYSIESGDPGGLFEIDAATGALSYRGAGEDYESGTTSYDLTVRASDGAAHSEVSVTVNVTDDTDEEELISLQQEITTDVSELPAKDLPADVSTNGAITVGGSATGEIEHRGNRDRDWFAVELEANKTYQIDLDGWWTGHGTLRDPYLRGIYDMDGVRIPGTTDDDGGAGKNSRVTFTAEDAGTYYVAAGAYGSTIVGTYTLSVTDITNGVPDDFAAGTDTTGTVDVGGSSTGEIEYEDDRDWFAVELDAGKNYRIDLEGASTDAGSMYDPYLRGIHDVDGNIIAGTTNDAAGAGRDSLVYFTATQAGTYYVAAGADRDGEGAYTLSVTELTDDYVAGTGTTGAVAVGGSSTGKIENPSDRDWFAVELEANRTYQIDLEGSATDAGTLDNPYLRGVYDAHGDLITGTTNDNGGAGYYNGRVYFTATANATYYVAAGAYNVGPGTYFESTGTYTLSVTDITNGVPDDFAAGTDTTGTVDVGGSSTGEIEFDGDRDWFAVDLEAGNTYRIDLEGSRTGSGTLRNTYLRGVYDADGNLISDTTDDNGGAGYYSRVDFTATADATYYVAAGAYESRTGTYTLSVTEIVDDYAAGIGTTGAVAVGGSAAGEIEVDGDHDWFAVTLQAGKTYRIDLEGSPTDAGTLSDPYLHGIHDADGNLIAGTHNNNRGEDFNSRVDFTATADAIYYVAARSFRDKEVLGAYGEGEGTYTLSVTDITNGVPDDFAAGTGTTGTVDVGGSVRGEIEVDGDRDWFAVELEAGTSYQIDLEGWWTEHGTHGSLRVRDPYLRGIYDVDGNLISGTTDDDGGAGSNSRVTFTAEDAGTYYVAAGAYESRIGTYTLSVEEVL